ncbi:MAG: glucokinase [Caldimonas sp.]
MRSDGSAPHPRLVGDVGGTQARFGWVAGPGGSIVDPASYACEELAGVEAAIGRYLAEHARPAPASCALAIAVPVSGDRLTMTNRDWSFSAAELRRALGVGRLVVLNDFTALALAVPGLQVHERRPVGGGSAIAGAPVAVLGPGTGLGVSGLLFRQGEPVPLAGEGGHVTLAAVDAGEDRLLARLRERFGHVSAERVLSGAGLVHLYQALCDIAGRSAEALAPADVAAHAAAGGDAACQAALEHFFAFLGSVAGNLALTLGARGGVYIGGGIVGRLGRAIDASRFRERFESKGRYRPYLAAIPTWVIETADAPALRGADRALDAAPPGAWTVSAD